MSRWRWTTELSGYRWAQRLSAGRSEPKRYRECHRTGEAERSSIEYSAGAPGLLQNLDSSVRFRPAPLSIPLHLEARRVSAARPHAVLPRRFKPHRPDGVE